MAEKGHKVHFISSDMPFRLLEYPMDNITFQKVTVNQYSLFKYPPYEHSLACIIAEAILEYNLDVIHVHYAVPHLSCAYLAKQMVKEKKQVKIFVTLHGTDISVMGYDKRIFPLLSFALKSCDAITAVSNALAKEAKMLFQLNCIRTIYNFIDVNLFTPSKVNHRLKSYYVDKNQKLLLHVSNLRSVKRPLDVLKIFQNVKTTVDCKLLIVGQGPNFDTLLKYIHEHQLGEYIYCLENPANLPELYSMSDLFLLPSEKESFGLAALEAMASGVPVVASQTGGIPELIEHGYSGYLAPVGDVENMAQYSIRLLQSNELHQRISQQARVTSVERFNKEYIVNQYEKLYYSYYN